MSKHPTDAERTASLDHIRSIFDAYLARDPAEIERTHTSDWVGFPVPTRKLVRGIDGYMREATTILETLNATRYEFLDVEVQDLGEHALVYYLARDWLAGAHGETSLLLRSLDVYRREGGGWNQCGSSISALPETLAPPPNPRQPSEVVRGQVLAAREEYWRAFFDGPEALEPLLPPEALAWVPATAAPLDRAAILEESRRFAADGARRAGFRFLETEVLAYGALVTLLSQYEIERAGKSGAERGRSTELYVHRAGRWWNVMRHLERME